MASSRFFFIFVAVCCFSSWPAAARNVDIGFIVKEETPIGTKVFDLSKSDSFEPNTSFDGSGSGPYFEISAQGVIRVHARLDRESGAVCPKQNLDTCRVTFVVLAGAQMRVVSVTVTIIDINDHAPSWGTPTLRVSVAENEMLKKRVPFRLAKDPDLGRNSVVNYRLASPSDYFDVMTSQGFGGRGAPPVPQLVVKANLDREFLAQHNLTVIAEDGGNPSRQGSVRVVVSITDENDNSPRFKKKEYSATIDEDANIDALVVKLQAEDRDEGQNARINYGLAISTPEEVHRCFRVDEKRGEVRVKAKLNYEVESRYEFQVIAQDSGSPPRSASTRVIVRLRDKNDHYPTIVAKPYPNHLDSFQVEENVANGTIMAAVTVKDADSGKHNNDVNCNLNPMTDFYLEFLATSVGQKIFRIYTLREFDREKASKYLITVTCWDGGDKPLTGYQDINIRIIDQNDNAPEFKPSRDYSVTVPENNAVGSTLLTTKAVDRDEGRNGKVTYAIVWPTDRNGQNPFYITKQGQIKSREVLDRERNPKGFQFQVIAKDNGEVPQSSTATVTLMLKDENDNDPQFEKHEYNFKVSETAKSYFGALVGTVNATDADAGRNGQIDYRILPDTAPFSMHTQGQIFTQSHMDRETKAKYAVTVLAVDMADDPMQRRTASVNVNIEILDINDNAPIFVYPNSSMHRAALSYREPPGFRLMTVKAYDRDKGENARISYEIISGNTYGVFGLDKDTGDLRVVRSMAKIPRSETVRLLVRATDSGKDPLFQEIWIIVSIDESEPLGLAASGEGAGVFDLETNKLIIICIVVATAIICAVLTTAICFMARGTPCLFGLGVRGFSSSSQPAHSRPEHVLVRPIQKTPMKSGSLLSLHTRPYTDPTAEASAPEVRFETFLGPLRTHAEEVADSDGDSGRGGSVKYFTHPDGIPFERHTYNNGALYVTVRPDTLTSNVSTSLV